MRPSIHDEDPVGVALARRRDRGSRPAPRAPRRHSARTSSITRICQSGSRLAVGSSSSSSLRPRRQRAGEQHAAAFAGRKLVDAPVAGSGSSSSSAMAAHRRRPSAIRSRASNGQAASRAAGRKVISAAPLAGPARRGSCAVRRHRSRRAADPGQRVKQAGLAAAVGADQADQLARRDVQRDIVQPIRQRQGARRVEHQSRSRQRICATSQRKKGAPSKAVTTPIGRVRPSGARRVDEIGGEQQQRADHRRRQDRPAGMAARSAAARRSARPGR